ncbi:MAG: hypothetical protein GY754_40795 [bacterium]|nr:hypothetical protein [bacterium]
MKKTFMIFLSICCLALFAAGCKSEEDQKEADTDVGKLLAEKKTRMMKGIGEVLKGEGEDAGDALGEGIADVFKGGAKGIDKSLSEVKVNLDANIAEKGLKTGRTAKLETGKNGITVYIIFDKAYNGKFLMKAFDAAGKEVGRTTATARGAVDDAKYVDFVFDERTPITIVDNYIMKAKN